MKEKVVGAVIEFPGGPKQQQERQENFTVCDDMSLAASGHFFFFELWSSFVVSFVGRCRDNFLHVPLVLFQSDVFHIFRFDSI